MGVNAWAIVARTLPEHLAKVNQPYCVDCVGCVEICDIVLR